jgi:hypothetical protein
VPLILLQVAITLLITLMQEVIIILLLEIGPITLILMAALEMELNLNHLIMALTQVKMVLRTPKEVTESSKPQLNLKTSPKPLLLPN